MRRCLIDMDGVVADFFHGVSTKHNKPWPYDNNRGSEAWNIVSLLDMTPNDFWSPLDYDFWYGLPKTTEADDIVTILSGHFGEENLCFLSSPCLTDGCMEAKRDWCHKHYPGIPLLLSVSSNQRGATPPKQFCASASSYLVDDHDTNVDKFIEYGGNAFLIPRPWNRAEAREQSIVSDLIGYLLEAE